MKLLGPLIIVLAGTFIFVLYLNRFPKDIIAGLKDNPKASITSATIHGYYEGESLSVSITNKETLRYLTDAFRNAGGHADAGGCYGIKVQLDTGDEADLMLMHIVDGNSVTILVEEPFPSDGKFYNVELKKPIPEELRAAFNRMLNK